MVVFAVETTPSPPAKTPRGNHLVCNDIISNFDSKWDDVIAELRTLHSTNPFKNSDYERLVHLVTGIWAMVPFERTYTFNENESSLPHRIKSNDELINHAVYSSDE